MPATPPPAPSAWIAVFGDQRVDVTTTFDLTARSETEARRFAAEFRMRYRIPERLKILRQVGAPDPETREQARVADRLRRGAQP